MSHKILKYLFFIWIFHFMMMPVAFAQKPKAAATKDIGVKASVRQTADKLVIDSLEQVIDGKNSSLDSLDALFEAEKLVTADLREQLIKLDDYRKKLETNVSSFKGENLKLNQSNRILIVFNSLVAVLLIISLVFFLRKIGRQKNAPSPSGSVAAKPGEQMKFTSFEDKLMQLERLGKLREKELLSEDEFMVEKQKILGKQ
jgi:hypothetical protein